ncbi:MAG: hypothetical protein IK081_12890 [Lachnospiraceae bacterium]|nr:hypothetical protein [Lachnospiraceae bacterium]
MAKDYKKVLKDKKLEAEKLMTEDQKLKCKTAIHTASVASGVAGAIPIPMADAIPISAAQITMVIALGKIFGQELTDAVAKGIIGAAASTFVGRNLVKLIPVAGSIVSATVAAGVTEAIGWIAAVDFAKNARNECDRKRNAQEAAEAGKTQSTDENNEGKDIREDENLDEILDQIITKEKNEKRPYAVVCRRDLINYKGNRGYLVWDFLMYNELTFEEYETGCQVSLASRYDDKKMERVFNGIVERYGEIEV